MTLFLKSTYARRRGRRERRGGGTRTAARARSRAGRCSARSARSTASLSWCEDRPADPAVAPYTSASARDMQPGKVERLEIEVYPTVARIAPGRQAPGDADLGRHGAPAVAGAGRATRRRPVLDRARRRVVDHAAERARVGASDEHDRLGRVQRVVLRPARPWRGWRRRDRGGVRGRARAAHADPPLDVPRGRAARRAPVPHPLRPPRSQPRAARPRHRAERRRELGLELRAGAARRPGTTGAR